MYVCGCGSLHMTSINQTVCLRPEFSFCLPLPLASFKHKWQSKSPAACRINSALSGGSLSANCGTSCSPSTSPFCQKTPNTLEAQTHSPHIFLGPSLSSLWCIDRGRCHFYSPLVLLCWPFPWPKFPPTCSLISWCKPAFPREGGRLKKLITGPINKVRLIIRWYVWCIALCLYACLYVQ